MRITPLYRYILLVFSTVGMVSCGGGGGDGGGSPSVAPVATQPGHSSTSSTAGGDVEHHKQPSDDTGSHMGESSVAVHHGAIVSVQPEASGRTLISPSATIIQKTPDFFRTRPINAHPLQNPFITHDGYRWARYYELRAYPNTIVTRQDGSLGAYTKHTFEEVPNQQLVPLQGLLNRVKDNIAKVLIIDWIDLNHIHIQLDRLTIDPNSTSAPNPKGHENELSHGELVALALLREPKSSYNYTWVNTDSLNEIPFANQIPSMMSVHGQARFLGVAEKNIDVRMVQQRIIANLRQGYKIISDSLAFPVYMSYQQARDKLIEAGATKILHYIDTKYHTDTERFDQILDTLGIPSVDDDVQFAAYIAKKYDASIILALGNSRNKITNHAILHISALHQEYPDWAPALNRSYFTVIAHDYQDKEQYSDTCELVDYTACIIGYDKTLTVNGDKINTARGTSFATPYIASVVGLTKSVFPFFTNLNLKTTVLTNAYLDKSLQVNMDPKTGISRTYGWGYVDPFAVVNGPKQFFFGDFNANLGWDNEYIEPYQVFHFTNDISGKYGLTVLNAPSDTESGMYLFKPAILSLDGKNTYQGDTDILDNGILNVDGQITQSKINISTDGALYGRGAVADVDNQEGTVGAFSWLMNPWDHSYQLNRTVQGNYQADFFNDQQGLLINGQYTQSKDSTLQAFLGLPLAVKGVANLDGTVDVVGVAHAHLDPQTQDILGEVVTSLHPIVGQFEQIKISSPLLSSNATQEKVQKNDHYNLVVRTAFIGEEGLVQKLDRADPDNTFSNRIGANNFTALYDSITNSANHTLSPLSDRVFSSMFSSLAMVQQTMTALNYKEYTQSLSRNHFASQLGMTDLRHYLLHQADGDNIQAMANTQFLAHQKDHLQRYAINIAVNHGRHHLGVQLEQGKQSWQVATPNKSEQDNHLLGVHLGYDYSLTATTRLATQIAYQQTDGQLHRDITLLNQSYSLSPKIDMKRWTFEGVMSHRMAITPQFSLQPYIGMQYAHESIHGQGEQYQDLALNVPHQVIQGGAFVSGLSAEIRPSTSLPLSINLAYDFYHAFSQPANFKAQLVGQEMTAPQSSHVEDANNQHHIAVGMQYQTERWNFGMSVNWYKHQAWQQAVQAQVGYRF